MVIRDDDRNGARRGGRHAVDAGNAVVHGDQQVRRALLGNRDDLRSQPVAELEAIRHHVIHMPGAHETKSKNRYGAAGGAVGIEVGNHQNALVTSDCIREQIDRVLDAGQGRHRVQLFETVVEVRQRTHVTRGQHASQHWVHGRRQTLRYRWCVASGDTRSHGTQLRVTPMAGKTAAFRRPRQAV